MLWQIQTQQEGQKGEGRQEVKPPSFVRLAYGSLVALLQGKLISTHTALAC